MPNTPTNERTWTNPKFDIYAESTTAVIEAGGLSVKDAFELCGRGTWKSFQASLSAKGVREGALFLKGEEEVMEEILVFFKDHKVSVKYQALCLAAASKAVRAPSPFPDEVSKAARNRLKMETEQIQSLQTQAASMIKMMTNSQHEVKNHDIVKECTEQLALTEECIKQLSGSEDHKKEASGKFMKTTRSIETMLKKSVHDLTAASEQLEASLTLFVHEQKYLARRLPQRRKTLIFFKIAMGAEHDLSTEDWNAMCLAPSDFDGLGDVQFKVGVTKKSPTIKNAVLPAVDLTGANLKGLTFSHCDLSKVKLGFDLQSIHFKHCSFGKNFSCKDRNLTNSSFEGCKLHQTDFDGAILAKTSFIFANLSGSNFKNVVFNQVDMRYSQLENCNFEGCDLSDSQLHHACLDCSNMKAFIPPKSLESTQLGGAIVDNVNLRSTSLKGAVLKGTSLRNTILPDGLCTRPYDLNGTDLSNAVVSNAKFDHSDLTNTILTGCNITNCSFVETMLPPDVAWGMTTDCVFEGTETDDTPTVYKPRIRVAAARNYAAAVTKEGQIHVWGDGFTGMPLRSAAAEVATTDDHCMALLEDGTVQAWNNRGMLVDFGLEDWEDIESIDGGKDQITAITFDGRVRMWRNGKSSEPPIDLPRVAKVATGSDHTLALLYNGKVVGWGANDHGQCNIPDFKDCNIVSVAAGAGHSVAVLEHGGVVAWGLNDVGQASPPPVFNAVAAACGVHHSVVLTSNSTIIGWGHNSVGQITTPYRAVNVASIAAGSFFSVALLYDGTIQAWGATDDGDISTTTPYMPFVRLP